MKKTTLKLLLFIIIALLFEVIIFNFGFFRTVFSGLESTDATYFVDTSNEEADIIYINNINTKVTSIKINYNQEIVDSLVDNYKQNGLPLTITYTPYFMLEGYSDYTMLDTKAIEINKDCTFLLDTTTKATTIALVTNTKNTPQIDSIKLNEPVFNFNIIRFCIIMLLFLYIDIIKNNNTLKAKYNFNDDTLKFKTIASDILILTCFAVIFIIYLSTQYSFLRPTNINSQLTVVSEPALSAQALLHNNGVLDINVSEELKNMENPYDYGIRKNQNINYSYDVSYYKGNYYSYFGLAPIITCVIPLRIITSQYFISIVYTAIFMVATLFIAFYVYKLLIIKYTKKDIPTILFYLGYFAIIFGSNYLTLLRGFKYDLPIASGIFYILLSMYFILTLNHKTLLKCILLGFSTALIVLSKPSFIVYYPILLILAIPEIKELYTKCHKEKTVPKFIVYIVSTIIPILILAIFQMWYNNLRFESIFEFGAKYQLTSYNMNILMSFSPSKVLYGLLKYIFALPLLNIIKFPFITVETIINMGGLNELTYQTRIIGLICIPLLYILFFKKFIIKKPKLKVKGKPTTSKQIILDQHLNLMINTILICGIILIALTTCMGGIGENYITDYKLLLNLFTIILWFKLLEVKDNNLRIRLFVILCIITILIYLPISLSGESNLLQNQSLSLTNYLTHTFEFWK